MNPDDSRHVVTGAAGRVGGHTVRALLQRGHPVTALVRRLDGRSADLAAAGADVVVADFFDIEALAAAMHGARRALFVYPVRPALVEAAAIFAEAATDAGVTDVVNVSQLSVRRDAGSAVARAHWLAERIFDWSPLSVTHLRPTLFAEWLTTFGVYTRKGGVLRLPMGQGRHAPLATTDLARLAVALLERPQGHAGKTYAVTGPVEMDHSEIADAVSRAWGRPVTYESVAGDAWITALHMLNSPADVAQHLSNVVVDYRDGKFAGTTDVVETFTGTKPMTVEEFVTRNLAAFRIHR